MSGDFEWMKPFMLPAADLGATGGHKQFAPPARDPLLRRAQDEDLLELEIWQLALSEAYAANNAGWFTQSSGRTKAEIVKTYLAQHPPMARFVAEHIKQGTCGDAVKVLQHERALRAAGPKPTKVPQNEVDDWMQAYYAAAHKEGRPPPKRNEEAFHDCRAKIGATDEQMREAIKKVPEGQKRKRGR